MLSKIDGSGGVKGAGSAFHRKRIQRDQARLKSYCAFYIAKPNAIRIDIKRTAAQYKLAIHTDFSDRECYIRIFLRRKCICINPNRNLTIDEPAKPCYGVLRFPALAKYPFLEKIVEYGQIELICAGGYADFPGWQSDGTLFQIDPKRKVSIIGEGGGFSQDEVAVEGEFFCFMMIG